MESSLDSVVALIAAAGGLTGLAALMSVIKKWREGIRGREADADEKLSKRINDHMERQDKRIESLEEKIRALEELNASHAKYISKLQVTLALNKIDIPYRDL